jgi:hypothetical protein
MFLVSIRVRVSEKFVDYRDKNYYIFSNRHGAGERIRLIEVNRNGFPTGRIEAFYFAPSQEVPFKTYLADVTPEEWQQILSGEIPLPEGWSREGSREFLRSEFEVASVG